MTCLGLGDAPIILIVCGPIATKCCTGIHNQSNDSNIEKNFLKLITSKNNDVIIVRKLAEETVKSAKKYVLKSLLLLHLLFNPTETLQKD